jgi:hypothetical protein
MVNSMNTLKAKYISAAISLEMFVAGGIGRN